MILSGLYTALITPFRHDGSIDRTAYRKHLQYQIEGGVDGLVVCGTTGESPTFSNEEFTWLVEEAVQLAAGKTPVIAGAGTNSTQKSIHRSRLAKKAGADGLLLVAPYYNKPPQRGLIEHYTSIADAVELPCMLYNVPGRTSVNITPETIAELAMHPYIVCVKEASGDIQQIMEVINQVPDDFPVFSGDDAMSLPIIGLGGKGLVSVAANETPRMMKKYVDACLKDTMHEARSLHFKLLPLMQANFWESNPIPVKAALAKMGRIENILRPPLSPLNPTHEKPLVNILKTLELL